MKKYLNARIAFKFSVVGLIFVSLGCSPQVEYSPAATKIIERQSIPSPIPTTKLETTSCASPETTIPEPNSPKSYIGKSFDTLYLPQGIEFIFGSLMEESDFSLVQIAVPSKSMQILWLVEIQCSNDYVHDALVLPVLKPKEMLVTNYCRISGEEDPEILAIGEYDPGMIPLKTIEHAWRANRDTKKFEELAPDGIECWRDVGITSP